jgi:hypothetical protein
MPATGGRPERLTRLRVNIHGLRGRPMPRRSCSAATATSWSS